MQKELAILLVFLVVFASAETDDFALESNANEDPSAIVHPPLYSDWSTWSECSRTCEGGASFARRTCFGRNCATASTKLIRYRVCNTEECDDLGEENFRAKQCASFDVTPHEGVLYDWVPDNEKDRNPCALFCRAKGTDIVHLKSSKVLDGTRCYRGSYDMCINGQCRRVGCDRRLDSNARLDKCGVCQGDGSTCRLMTGIFRPTPQKREGSEVVVTVPKNSRRITVTEMGTGHVAIHRSNSSEDDFLVPGKLRNRTVMSSGLLVHYGRLIRGKEFFKMPGPLPTDFDLMATYDENLWKYIRYEFYRPLKHAWKHDESNAKCTVTCGGGLLFVRPICINFRSGERKDDELCQEEGVVAPSPKVHRCNVEKCPDRSSTGRRYNTAFEYTRGNKWQIHPWTKCSAECAGGFQTRTLTCVEEMIDGRALPTLDNTTCQKAGLKVPETRRACNENPCPLWKPMRWNPCSVTCGMGWQHRTVKCETFDGRPAFGSCDMKYLPPRKRTCSAGPCFASQSAAYRVMQINLSPEPSWNPESWSDCSTSCGPGVTTRIVRCMAMRRNGSITDLSDTECPNDKPTATQPCSMGACVIPTLPTSYDIRVDYDHDNEERSSYDYDDEYATNDTVASEDEHLFGWKYVPVGSCTTPCGSGLQRHEQFCFHVTENQVAAVDRCALATRLPAKELPCDNEPCPTPPSIDSDYRWSIGLYDDCNVTCGRGMQTRNVVCRKKPEGLDAGDLSQDPGELMHDKFCPAPKPAEQRVCSQVPCSPLWVPRPWDQCSRQCGFGFQRRTLSCERKLGTGRTEPVSEFYCPPRPPPIRRRCNVRNCRPYYSVRKWQQCKRKCGKELVKRRINCMQQKAGRSRPSRVPPKVCSKLRRPLSRKFCQLPKCPPGIFTTRRPFIQSKRMRRVRINVGSSAFVYPQTTVVIRCHAERIPKKQIRWMHEGAILNTRVPRVFKMPDASLRIIRAAHADSGNYTCLAGAASASLQLFVTRDPQGASEILKYEIPSPEPRTTTTVALDDSIDVPGPSSYDGYFDTGRTHFPYGVPRGPKLHNHRTQVVQYKAPTPVLVRSSADPSPSAQDEINNGFRPSKWQPAEQENDDNDDDDLDQETRRIKNLLELIVSKKQFPVNHIDKGGVGQPDQSIYPFLVQPQSDLPESNDSAPTIQRLSSHPPFQLGTKVDAYVGGYLIVAGAEHVTLLCEATGNPKPEIKWYKDDVRLPQVGQRQYILLGDNSLRIFQPQKEDAGAYTCVAVNVHGNDSVTTDLTVAHKPQILSTTENFENLTSDSVDVTVGANIRAKLGARIRIRCPTEAYAKPVVVWMKDSGGLRHNAKTLTDNSLELNPTTAADQGLYGCEATNPVGSDYQASTLVLIDPPHVSEDLSVVPDVDGIFGDLPELLMTRPDGEVYRVKANSSVMMGCPITGFPEPHVTWRFNGTPISELGAQLDYQLLHQDKILQIPIAGQETAGTYTCAGINEGGNCTTSLTLGRIVYTYVLGDFSECSASCGGSGIKRKVLRCLADGNREVDNWYCMGVREPERTEYPCNRVDCPPRFVTGPWGACASSCGNSTRTRATPCVVLMSDGSAREVADEECLQNQTRPVSVMGCYGGECPKWKAGPWRKCSKKCVGSGIGRKVRRVLCVTGNGTLSPRSACKGQPRPRRRAACANPRCKPVWVTSPWSVCSKSCGTNGYRTRILNCVYHGRRKQKAGKLCSVLRQPQVRMPCNRRLCDKAPTAKTSLPPGTPCSNLSRSCFRIKNLGLCSRYMRLCCAICSR